MPTLGRITVPSNPPSSAVFPLTSDFPYGRAHNPRIVEHRFGAGAADGKITQRFILGNGAKTFTVRRAVLSSANRAALLTFWTARQGPYQPFHYLCPKEDASGTDDFVVRFADDKITFDGMQSALTGIGVSLIEVPQTTATYTITSTVPRFPTPALKTALLSQVQTIIPLIKIQPKEPGYPAIYISDRNVTLGTQLWQARLLETPEVSQSISLPGANSGDSDQLSFSVGNADRVWTAIRNDTVLRYAWVEYSWFHVGTGIKLDFWAGLLLTSSGDSGPIFGMTAGDRLSNINLYYPVGMISRTCPKKYMDGLECHATGAISASRTFQIYGASRTITFSADATTCDRGWDTPNGCLAHLNETEFGGQIVKPQGINIKDNSQGTFGFGRPTISAYSTVSDTVYSELLPDHYVDLSANPDTSVGMPVDCKIVAGRDEGEFWAGLGIVGAGPLKQYATQKLGAKNDPTIYSPFTLDLQHPHGWPIDNYGLRLSLGNDPVVNRDGSPNGVANDSDKFSLGQGKGTQTYDIIRAAGTAFCEIRRTDAVGQQLSNLSDHHMQASIRQGLEGYMWGTDLTTRTFDVLSNPFWVALRVYLRGLGLLLGTQAQQEAAFDIGSFAADPTGAAVISDLVVPKIIGSGTEKQFLFAGSIVQSKPLRDWLTEILNNGLGFYTFSFGKLRVGTRINASAVEAFTDGNILWQSLKTEPIEPAFWSLTANFNDGEFDFAANAVRLTDFDYAELVGGNPTNPPNPGQLNLTGAYTKSQASRIVITRLREELGGMYRPDKTRKWLEYSAAMKGSMGTTALALNVEPGMVCSLTHPDMPDYQASHDGAVPDTANYGEFRIQRLTWKKDYSVQIDWRTVHRDCYDFAYGPKPQDVIADPIPTDNLHAPSAFSFNVSTYEDGKLNFDNLNVGSGGASVTSANWEIYYVDESQPATRASATILAADVAISWFGAPPPEKIWVLIDSEILYVKSVTAASASNGTMTVDRAQFGTVAVDHNRQDGTIASFTAGWHGEMVIETGKTIYPGDYINHGGGGFAPSTDPSVVAEYQSDTGFLRTTLPFVNTMAVADAVHKYVRIWPLDLTSHVISLRPGFFRSPSRADYTVSVDLPSVGVVLVRGQVSNTRDVSSDFTTVSFAYKGWPWRLRTGGGHKIEMTFISPPIGLTLSPDSVYPVTAPATQSVMWAYSSVTRDATGSGLPITAPRAGESVQFSDIRPAGTITVGGTISVGAVIDLSINGIVFPTWVAAANGITGASTVTQVATSLAAFWNADPQFDYYYEASSALGVVSIIDRVGAGGAIVSNAAGGITTTVSGLTSSLGIMIGRRYAISYVQASPALESDVSPLSDSTGPSSGATKITLRDIPVSLDSRVTGINVYATPDGADSPLYRIASIANAAATNLPTATFNDTQSESGLAALPKFGGPVQPALPGSILETFYLDGAPWFHIYTGASTTPRSINGVALGWIPRGAQITADIDNQAGDIDCKAVIDGGGELLVSSDSPADLPQLSFGIQDDFVDNTVMTLETQIPVGFSLHKLSWNISTTAALGILPVGRDAYLDIEYSVNNGTSWASIFPSGNANKIHVPAAGPKFGSVSVFNLIYIPSGTLMRAVCIQAGTTTPGTGLQATLY